MLRDFQSFERFCEFQDCWKSHKITQSVGNSMRFLSRWRPSGTQSWSRGRFRSLIDSSLLADGCELRTSKSPNLRHSTVSSETKRENKSLTPKPRPLAKSANISGENNDLLQAVWETYDSNMWATKTNVAGVYFTPLLCYGLQHNCLAVNQL